MLHESLYHLREEFRRYAKEQAPDIFAFCGDALFADHEENTPTATVLSAVDQIHRLQNRTSIATQSLFEAVLDASSHLHWKHSYTTDDAGIDQNHLDNYGWFNLIAPSGPFVSDTMRLSVGYWGKGLTYPNHWHEPEEIYLTIAGSALYISEGREPVNGGPGTTICHYSNQPHSADFADEPLLAAAFWRGRNLEKKSVLENLDGT